MLLVKYHLFTVHTHKHSSFLHFMKWKMVDSVTSQLETASLLLQGKDFVRPTLPYRACCGSLSEGTLGNDDDDDHYFLFNMLIIFYACRSCTTFSAFSLSTEKKISEALYSLCSNLLPDDMAAVWLIKLLLYIQICLTIIFKLIVSSLALDRLCLVFMPNIFI